MTESLHPAIPGQPTNAGNAVARLERAVCSTARKAARNGERVVKVQTTIRVGRPRDVREPAVDARRTLLLDPKQISLSPWANRLEQSYLNLPFLELKRSIQHDGGNQIPILVRPLRGNRPAGLRYELAYGHRRLRACLELGLPVRAIVEELTESGLVARMHAENRDRAGLSVYESGVFYKRLIDEKVFDSQRKLAEALGVDHADVSRKVWLAALPADVLRVFRSPLEVSSDDVKRWQPAWNRDPDAMRRRAIDLYEAEGPSPPKPAIARMIASDGPESVGGSNMPPTKEPSSAYKGPARDDIEIQASGPEGITLRVNVPLAPSERNDLLELVAKFLRDVRGPAASSPARP